MGNVMCGIDDLTFDLSDSEEQLWVWQYEAEDGTHDMFMDLEEEVRFRVVQETFVDTLPTDGEAVDHLLCLPQTQIEHVSQIMPCPRW